MKKLLLLVFTFATALLIGGLMTPKTSAIDPAPPPVQIYITPVEVNLSLDPGEVYDGTFEVRNSGAETYDFRVSASQFYVKDLTYETTYDDGLAFNQIIEWITFDQTEFRGLEPNEKQEVAYHIKVPKDAPGGGQYAVLFATVSSKVSDGGYDILTDSRVGVKVYAQIAGKTRLEGKLESVNQARFYQKGPINSTVRVKNTGNVDFNSTHEYVIKSLGGRELYRDSISKRIMPGTVREIGLKWWDKEKDTDETPMFGIFRVQNKVYFIGKVQYDEENIVVVAPIWLVIILAIVLLLIIGLIILLIMFLVKRNRHKKILESQKSEK